MKKHTKIMPMLPGFYAPERGHKSRTPQQVFAERLASIKEKTFKTDRGDLFALCTHGRPPTRTSRGHEST